MASVWQCASAPASPPRLPPSPMVSLVTKKFIIGDGFAPRGNSPGLGACAINRQDASKSVQDNIRAEDLILVMFRSKCERRVSHGVARGQRLFTSRLTLQISDKTRILTCSDLIERGWWMSRE